MTTKRLIKFILFFFFVSCTVTKEVKVIVPIKVPIPPAILKLDSAKATTAITVAYDINLDVKDTTIKPIKAIKATLDTSFDKIKNLHLSYEYPKNMFSDINVEFKPDTFKTKIEQTVKIQQPKPSWKETHFWTIILVTILFSLIFSIILTLLIVRKVGV